MKLEYLNSPSPCDETILTCVARTWTDAVSSVELLGVGGIGGGHVTRLVVEVRAFDEALALQAGLKWRLCPPVGLHRRADCCARAHAACVCDLHYSTR